MTRGYVVTKFCLRHLKYVGDGLQTMFDLSGPCTDCFSVRSKQRDNLIIVDLR